MPVRYRQIQFDRYLAERGVLLSDGAYGEVHEFMDLGVESFDAEQCDYDPFHEEEGLRSWINGKYNVIGQDRATDWLRAGLGHICLDEVKSSLYGRYSWESVFDSAYRSMAQRGWTRSRFVPRK